MLPNSGSSGNSDNFEIFKSSKNSLVVANKAGLPGTSLCPTTLIQDLSNRVLIIWLLTDTPRTCSISRRGMGCF